MRDTLKPIQFVRIEKADNTTEVVEDFSSRTFQKENGNKSFSTDQPETRNRKDSMLTVVDKTTLMMHLLPHTKSITAAEIASLFWDYSVKLH